MILARKSRGRRRSRSCFVRIATALLVFSAAAVVMLPRRSLSLIPRVSTSRRRVLAFTSQAFPLHGSGSRRRASLADFRFRASRTLPSWFTAIRSTSSLHSDTSSASSTIADDKRKNVVFSTDDLNPSQLSAVTQPVDALVRVISGPGSGKTRVLTSRIVHLLMVEDDRRKREGWDARNDRRRGDILAVTFTRKAAGEMQERIQSMVQDQRLLSRATLGTFHSICAKILRWNGGLINSLPIVQREAQALSANGTTLSNNMSGDFVIIDDGEQSRILRSCMEEAGVSIKDSTIRLGTIQSAMNEYKEALSQGNNQPFGNSGKGVKGLSTVQQMVLKLYPLYREHMLSHNCVDFDDLIYYCRDLLMNHADVRERLQSKWTHVLVDEFQDTSKSQLDLVKLWTSNSLMVVGDADQSIYSWRGAHAGSLSDFDTEFQSWGNVSTVFLMENYRSTSNIIMAAQKVISHRSHSEEATGADKLRRNMKPKRGKGPPPRIIRFKDGDEEARFVVSTVKDARAVGNYSIDHTVAFIYRTNAQSRALEEACVQANLPYVIYGSATSFYKRLEIKDCLCYLRWLANGNDRIAMLRALTTPKRGIGDSTIQEFESYSAELIARRASEGSEGLVLTLLDALVSITDDPSQDYPQPRDFLSSRSVKVLTEFARSMKNLRTLADREPLEAVLKFVVDEMGLVPYLDKASKTAAEFEERMQNIRELQQATRRYTDQGPALGTDMIPAGGEEGYLESPLSSFLDDVALVTDLADRSADERFVVNLMTIHASKGKEFDTVFVVGNEDGTFPTSQAIMEGEGSVKLEEEKRLCYVAMTRAKTELFLTWRQLVNVFTTQGIRQENRGRSRFLDVLVGEKGGKVTKSDRSTPSLSHEPNRLDARRSYATSSAPRSQTSDRRSTFSGGTAPSRGPPPPPPRYGQWQKKPGPVVVPPEPARREGTTSVYGRSSPPMPKPLPGRRASISPIVPPRRKSPTSPSSSIMPPPTRSSSPRRRIDADSEVRQQPRRSSSKSNDDGWATATTTQPRSVDGNLFYPVGSDVVHKAFGKGVVQPRPPTETDPMMVHVQFSNGRQDKFSARGTELLPDLLS